MAITFFKTPKNKKFDYRPVYYDAKKDEMEQRFGKSGKKSGEEGYDEQLRERMKSRWRRSASVANEKRNSNLRLALILLILGVVAYYFLR